MEKKNTPGGCCCCRILYGGLNLHTGNFKAMPGDPIESPGVGDAPDPYEWPVEGNQFASSNASGAPWAVDHRNQKIVMAGTASPVSGTQVSVIDSTIPLAAADINRVAISGASTTSPEILRGVGCLPWTDGGRALWVVQMTNTTPATYEIRTCKYDGTGHDSFAFADTLSSVTHPFYCKANDKLYYVRVKSGVDDGKASLYRCDLDGSNNEYVWHPGPNTGSPLMTVSLQATAYTFDNVNQKLYLSKSYANTTSGVDNWGEVYQMNLDGSSPSLYYETTKLVRPHSSHGVRAMKYSHKDKGLYFICYSSELDSSPAAFPEHGLFFLSDADGTAGVSPGAATHLKSMNQCDVISSSSPPSIPCFDLGCGFETMGTSTKR